MTCPLLILTTEGFLFTDIESTLLIPRSVLLDSPPDDLFHHSYDAQAVLFQDVALITLIFLPDILPVTPFEWGFPRGSAVECLPMQEMQESMLQSLGQEDSLGEWQPTLVFLSEKSHGQRSLAGHSPWGREESDTT